MEDLLYEKLDKKKKDRITQYEILGNAMVEAGNEFGPGTPYGECLFVQVLHSSTQVCLIRVPVC